MAPQLVAGHVHQALREGSNADRSDLAQDEAALRASTRKLLELVDREGVKLVVIHHDGG